MYTWSPLGVPPPLIQENGVMTLSGRNVDVLEFSDCSVLVTFLI